MKKLTFVVIATLLVILLIAVPAHTQEGSLSGYKICLDPGHGGSDPGAVNQEYFLEEKDINLDVAYGLKALLEADEAEVVMTRYGNDSRSNNDRYTFCNSEQANILVSVHTNSSTNQSMDGSLGLYFHQDDKALAQAIYEVMYPYLMYSDTAINPDNFTDFGLDRFASGVLLKSDMPAAMMEPLFMSNLAEAELLVQSIYDDPSTASFSEGCVDFACRRGQIAQALYQGVLNYFGGAEPTPTPTPEPGGTGTIKGTVTDDNTGARLGGVLVETDTGQSATTNRRGMYRLKDVPEGERTVTASKTGYVTQPKSATVVADQTTVVDFALVPL